jgi:6-phosphogluconolactonase
MYVICELNSTISALNVDEGGRLSIIQTLSTITDDFKGKSFCADVHFGIDYKYLYGSNRGENDIITFKPGTDGKLEIIGRTPCGGNWPRNFVIDPSGKFILVGNKRSGDISLLKIDEKTGIPAETGKGCKIETPACLKF